MSQLTSLNRRQHPRLVTAAVFVAALVLALFGAQAFFPAQASAATVDLACTGPANGNYSPGFTFTPQTVSFTGSFTYTCVGDPNITSGSVQLSGQGTSSCGVAFPASSSTSVITWNTGETSTIDATSLVRVNGLGVVTVALTGEVTAGKFLGDDYTSLAAGVPTSGSCLSSGGVTQTSGALAAAFSH